MLLGAGGGFGAGGGAGAVAGSGAGEDARADGLIKVTADGVADPVTGEHKLSMSCWVTHCELLHV